MCATTSDKSKNIRRHFRRTLTILVGKRLCEGVTCSKTKISAAIYSSNDMKMAEKSVLDTIVLFSESKMSVAQLMDIIKYYAEYAANHRDVRVVLLHNYDFGSVPIDTPNFACNKISMNELPQYLPFPRW